MTILTWPNEKLSKLSRIVSQEEIPGPECQGMIDEMFALMYAYEGVGLAAVQVGVPVQVFIADVGPSGQFVFINPQILELSGDISLRTEGCLSFPGFYEKVKRFPSVTVKALDRNGKEFVLNTNSLSDSNEARLLLAQVIQHEWEHLQGITIEDNVDYEAFTRWLRKFKGLK